MTRGDRCSERRIPGAYFAAGDSFGSAGSRRKNLEGAVPRPSPDPLGPEPGVEIYSRLALADAQQHYDDVIEQFPV